MGFRTQEEEDALERMTLDEFLIDNREASFLMRAASDSMRGEGILRGDLLLVDRSKDPRPGDIVISVEEGAFALRQFSENVSKVEAVVTSVIRKLR
jgi:SOS-response transcriptional repressor LexA